MNGVFASAAFRYQIRMIRSSGAAQPFLLPGSVLSSFVKALSLSIAPAADLYSQTISLICQPNWQKHPSIAKLIPTISPSHFSSFLSHHPNLSTKNALELFDFLTLTPGFKPNVETYASLLHFLVKNKAFADAEKIRILMVRSCQAEEDARLALSILLEFNRGGDDDRKLEALNLFEEMKEKGIKPNVHTYTAFIDAACREGMLDEGRKLLGTMLDNRKKCTKQWLSLGDTDSALRLLRLMEENYVVADQFTYCPIIVALCEKGSVDEAFGIFESLKVKGIKANEVIYTALIGGYCSVEKVDFALQLFKRMSAESCLPNSYTYNVLINGLCKVNKLFEAFNYMEKMLEMGMKPSIVTYSIVIEQMLKDFDFDRAYKVLNYMVAMGCKPDVCTYTSFLVAYCNQGMLKEAEDMMAKMKEEGVRPDLMAFTVLIDGYGRSGFLELAFSTLKSMIAAGCEPSDYTYSVLIKHLSHEKLIKRSGRTWLDSKPINLSINIADVWKIMDHDTALKLLENMEKYGCPPTIKTYNALITGLCRERRLDEAWRLVDHLRQCGLSPNEDMYNKLVDCCCNLKLLEEATNIIGVMLKHGLLPHLESFKVLVCELYNEGSDEKGKATFCQLLQCGYNYDEVAWKVLLDGLLKRGFVKGFYELVGVMEINGCPLSPQTHSMLNQGIRDHSADGR
ncbi:pentatricopeptide repeat-containing protein At5g65560 isoform X5 [Salvia miltiorrhiza]|uniref:pentatricopeptide repeat-containing protein At5g65560 isoform X5 n=1 Tax=Salvia miltiorrhiza TaxID=226208 RepID=UPI0025ABDA0B|nr:pentatricopeptide repeat-containing protein At5g65560 isoform X5 [Salvia miltiorrhiza]